MKKRFLPRAILTVLITLGFVGWMWINTSPKQAEKEQPALIGGAFSLLDTHGNRVNSEALKGKYSLVFFGFTHCPAVCPTALLTMTKMLGMLDEAERNKLTPVFISVDPARDTPQVMAEYLASFHPAIVGLTGSEEEIRVAQDAYKVFASKQQTGAGAEDYTMDHSGYLYLMAPDGHYLTHFAHTASDAELSAALKTYLDAE